MNSRWLLSFFLLVVSWGSLSPARVFSAKDERFAAYVRGSYAPMSFENTLNSGSHGTGSTLDSSNPYNLSGEFGFIYSVENVGFRFSLEVIRPPDKKNESGTDSGGESLYTLTSEVSVVAPKIGMDLTLKRWNINRFYLGVAAGYASLAARNAYSMTAAGTTQYSGLTDFSEDLRAGAPIYEGLLGYESLLNDTTTVAIETVYRNLVFKDVKHNKDVTNFKGSFVKGDAAVNDDGSVRTLNFSQFYFGVNVRFWVH